mmetsp:Transcript_21957/g.61042  ORF Transcript_21957/g.61042 Transcript_21957/m.61042 type:complete len:207 (+) Transcript_21957:377-997(+)
MRRAGIYPGSEPRNHGRGLGGPQSQQAKPDGTHDAPVRGLQERAHQGLVRGPDSSGYYQHQHQQQCQHGFPPRSHWDIPQGYCCVVFGQARGAESTHGHTDILVQAAQARIRARARAKARLLVWRFRKRIGRRYGGIGRGSQSLAKQRQSRDGAATATTATATTKEADTDAAPQAESTEIRRAHQCRTGGGLLSLRSQQVPSRGIL